MKNDDLPNAELTAFEMQILRAMRICGDLAPEAADEVSSAEAVWDEVSEQELPDSLRDAVSLAAEIADGKFSEISACEPSSTQVELERGLARAARFGNNISADVEAAMRRDKRHARKGIDKS